MLHVNTKVWGKKKKSKEIDQLEALLAKNKPKISSSQKRTSAKNVTEAGVDVQLGVVDDGEDDDGEHDVEGEDDAVGDDDDFAEEDRVTGKQQKPDGKAGKSAREDDEEDDEDEEEGDEEDLELKRKEEAAERETAWSHRLSQAAAKKRAAAPGPVEEEPVTKKKKSNAAEEDKVVDLTTMTRSALISLLEELSRSKEPAAPPSSGRSISTPMSGTSSIDKSKT